MFCFSDIDGCKTNFKVITVTPLLHDQDIHYYTNMISNRVVLRHSCKKVYGLISARKGLY